MNKGKMELLAPAGSFEKLKVALNFGADAVYVGGQNFSLRAFADNFNDAELEDAVKYVHARGKKIYVTLNIFPKNADFAQIESYLRFLDSIGADGVLVSDFGVARVWKRLNLKLPLHVSTQANTLNREAALAWAELGASRIVLARELGFAEIEEIRNALPDEVEIETFVHGAMCISMSGRCLLSNYFNGRDANRGECVQACRWEYALTEKNRDGEFFPIEEDARGTYVLNSRDLNMIEHLDRFQKAGVASLKIEGRMKSKYYVATVVNAYRRAMDDLDAGKPFDKALAVDLDKAGHRNYTTAYYLGPNDRTQNHDSAAPQQSHDFIATVEAWENGVATVVMRNRFRVGEELEILSPSDSFNKTFTVTSMWDEEGNPVEDAKLVCQTLKVACELPLSKFDILRRKRS